MLAGLPGGGQSRQPAGAGDLRSSGSRVRYGGRDPHRQRAAVCVACHSRVVTAGGVVDQAGHCAATDSGWTSRAERTARTYAPYTQGSNRLAPGQSAGPAAGLRPVPARVQRGTSAPGAGHADAGSALPQLATPVSGTGAGAGVRDGDAGATGTEARGVQLETQSCVSQRSPVWGTCRPVADRLSLLPRILRDSTDCPLRPTQPTDSPALHAKSNAP